MNEDSIFIVALQKKDPTDRQAYLQEACKHDAELGKRIEALLSAHENVASFMARPAVARQEAGLGIEEAVTQKPTTAPAGTSNLFAGKFKIREKLGEGGMGAVYVADQVDPIQRRVALKLIKGDFASGSLLARFDQERQALALMDHPNIAKVFDAGMAPGAGILGTGNVPYFVMEMIKGLPITKYCDEAKLSPIERLKLFIPVCQAVQHAHHKGIIHRDLKPNNILVGLYDGRPVPKVIDFGVAKATGSRLTQESIYTEVGSIVGTLEYMSPEQAEFNNLDIDTRTDIYALGIILYELLTGEVPFSQKMLMKTGIFKMLMKIKEEEPAKPSTKLSNSDSLPNVAATRSIEPRKLTTLVKGDLDWIVMKALEKDRNRRYETANGFAQDIERFLGNEPVLASPPSTLYRFRKYVKRNRALVGAGLVVLLALIAGVIGTSWGLVQAQQQRDHAIVAEKEVRQQRDLAEAAEKSARQQRDVAEAAEKEARSKKAETEAINHFLINDLLEQADPSLNAVSEKVTIRQLLDRASKKIENNPLFKDLPSAEGGILSVVGSVYNSLGLGNEAEPHLVRCLKLITKEKGAEHLDTLIIMHELAYCLEKQHKWAEAAKLYQQVIEIRSKVQSPEHPNTLTAQNNLAEMLRHQGKNEEAEQLHRQVLETRLRTLGEEHPDTMESLNNLGSLAFRSKNYEKARELFQKSYEVRVKKLGPNHPLTVTSMSNLATALKRLNRFAEAEPLARKALELDSHTLGPEHPDTLSSLSVLAGLLHMQGKNEEAEKLFRECLILRKKVLPPNNSKVPGNCIDLADLLVATKRPAEAEPFYREGLQLRERFEKPGDYQIQDARRKLGNCLIQLKKYAEAEPFLLAAIDALEKAQQASPKEKQEVKDSLVKLYTDWNKPDQAIKWKPMKQEPKK